MTLTSSIRELIALTNMDMEEQYSLDRLALKLEELSDYLPYDQDYDIAIFIQNLITNEDNEENNDIHTLYNKVKRYGIELLKRYGIVLNDEIEQSDCLAIVEAVVEVLSLEPEFSKEILEEIQDETYETTLSKFIRVVSEYTSVEEHILDKNLVECGLQLFTHIEMPVVNEDVNLDLKMISTIEALNPELLKASVMKPLIKLGETRYPNVTDYAHLLSECNWKSDDDIVASICLVFLHVDQSCLISASEFDKTKEYYVDNRVDELKQLSVYDASKDLTIKPKIRAIFKKLQGVKL